MLPVTQSSRIVIVGQCIHGLGLGGAQKVIASIVRCRDPERFDHLVYSPHGGVLEPELATAGARVRIVPRHLPRLDPFWIVRLAGAFRRDGVELVHTHLFGDTLHALVAARLAGSLPVLATVHNDFRSFTAVQRFGYGRILPRVERVVACSAHVAGSLLEASPGLHVVTIHNGIEWQEDGAAPAPEAVRRELLAQENGTLLAAVSRLTEQKGHRHLLAAFARASHELEPATRLLLIGDGPLRPNLESQARELGIAGRVRFLGFRPDVATLLRGVDAVVFSSLYEGLPIALLEAMASARALVATELPGFLEALRPERDALIVPPADVEALSRALVRISNDAGLRRRLGEAARRRFLERFTAEAMVASYQALYREILAARAGREPALGAA